MAVSAISLDRALQIRRATLADDGYSKTEVFADFGAPIRGGKVEVSDGERWRAAQVGASISARFTVRRTEFTVQLGPQDRILCEGREYEITGIREHSQDPRRFYEIAATAEITS
ncbi:hypothetical protein P775_14235 [Puniceibacterium antarcticum]|uniref:Head-tail adaptor protein n=1 Tax=Puniceibacterium antarcticum TaxID=1206336 RepID=A0A2G8REJ0_9RHOB|nr:head-tail adaptor protein [Puniceibacterium antarcticum]PIL19508.1 hypothetical protein P775_14235 [Puniceibacterium antarcticum]